MTLKEKFEDIEDLGRYSEHGYSVWSTKVLEEQSTKCVKIADEYAIEFALWVKNNVKILTRIPNYTDVEVLQIFKKEKGL